MYAKYNRINMNRKKSVLLVLCFVGIAVLTSCQAISGGYTESFMLNLTMDLSEQIKISPEATEEANRIINKIITRNMTEVDKVKAIHDYIILNTAYDVENMENETLPDSSFTVEGVLFKGIAVCQGYAETFQLFMDLLGIESKIVVGTGKGIPHAWNMVSLYGKWYHIDVTWNDPIPDQKGEVQYNYFLVTDDVIAVDHIWNRSDYPVCNSEEYKYFVYKDYIVRSIDQYESKFKEQFEKGERAITVLYPEKDILPDFNKVAYAINSDRFYYTTSRFGDYTIVTVYLDKR